MDEPGVRPMEVDADEFDAVAPVGRGVFGELLLQKDDGVVLRRLAQDVVGLRRQRGGLVGGVVQRQVEGQDGAKASSRPSAGLSRQRRAPSKAAAAKAAQNRENAEAGRRRRQMILGEGDAHGGGIKRANQRHGDIATPPVGRRVDDSGRCNSRRSRRRRRRARKSRRPAGGTDWRPAHRTRRRRPAYICRWRRSPAPARRR